VPLQINVLLFQIALIMTHAVTAFVLVKVKLCAQPQMLVFKLQFVVQLPVITAESVHKVQLSALTLIALTLQAATSIYASLRPPTVPQDLMHAEIVFAHQVKFTALHQILVILH
jgi:hypothetical protein